MSEPTMPANVKPYRLLDPASQRGQEAAFSFIARALKAAEADAPEPLHIVEAFGGTGAASAIFREALAPRTHVAVEWDAKCWEELAVEVPDARLADTYGETPYAIRSARTPAFVSLDFPTFTALWMEREPHAKLLDAVAERRPLYVHVTDSAISKLHLNRDSYREALGERPRDRHHYIRLLGEALAERFGGDYTLIAAAFHAHAAVVLLRRGEWAYGAAIRDVREEGA